MHQDLATRRACLLEVGEEVERDAAALPEGDGAPFDDFDLIYRSLCALLYNYAPTSGHPGGSISSGRIVTALLFDTLDYDLSQPDRGDADLLCYAAGHKALGLYAMWALRDEIARIAAPDLLPRALHGRLRLEDLLGFRRNPTQDTPLFTRLKVRPLDGHPTPATPFVRVATGASGVGVATAVGLALGARDVYGGGAPRVHVVEGEGGLTPGRVSEALAAASTARLDNLVVHVDWNQASIDTDRVCGVDGRPGDYVAWNPAELFRLHDWNVISVRDGLDMRQVLAAQRQAQTLDNGQPTAVVYRTVKGWQYGIEGRASHGAGHKLCSDGFFQAMMPLLGKYEESLPYCCDDRARRCEVPGAEDVLEECFWAGLEVVRRAIEREDRLVQSLGRRLADAVSRLERRRRSPRVDAPRLEGVFEAADCGPSAPEGLALEPGTSTTLRAALGRALGHLNRQSNGAMFVASADLLGSTSADLVAAGFGDGYFDARGNPGSRRLSAGGICEDGMSGIAAGLSSFGHHIGVVSSYAAFLAALGHVPARLHAIGAQARRSRVPGPYATLVLICAHAGLKTGEDGPTHADPQALQLLQENFPRGTAITLTPWEPAEVWPLLAAALARRPAVLAPFVTRPEEVVPDRAALALAPAEAAVTGVYPLRRASGAGDGTVVLQGSGVTLEFVRVALPRLIEAGVDLNVYVVSSAELFDLLPREQRSEIFPEAHAREAIGITGFTLPTLLRWVTGFRGREASLHPYRRGHYLGSGPAARVLAEAGLDGESQARAVMQFVRGPVSA